ncbi:MAG: hypothetical protein ISQ09_13650 [Rubripirellula sp.]|jgi:hypothetical protein|nr:hypothetical protein [Rubripirellula sp.]
MDDSDSLNLSNDTKHEPRPLTLRFPMWVALGLVLLIGIQKYATKPQSTQHLGYLEPARLTVRHSEDTVHTFNRLGISVDVANGWAYLSISEDQSALSPTFSHASSGTILRLQPFHLEQWPPEGSESQKVDEGSFEMLWVPVGRLLVGRLILGDVDLAVVVMDHQQGELVSSEILDFCRRVQRFEL